MTFQQQKKDLASKCLRLKNRFEIAGILIFLSATITAIAAFATQQKDRLLLPTLSSLLVLLVGMVTSLWFRYQYKTIERLLKNMSLLVEATIHYDEMTCATARKTLFVLSTIYATVLVFVLLTIIRLS